MITHIEPGAYWLRVTYLNKQGETSVFQEMYYLHDKADLDQSKQSIKEGIEMYGGKLLGEFSVKPYKAGDY